MQLRELRTLLAKIVKCHPEAANADVWFLDTDGVSSPVSFVGYDKRHKPARIKLEA
jgi:hypothetical protein